MIVDGLFGTGFHGELPEAVRPFLERREGRTHIAVDIPSGGNGGTGTVSEGAFRADLTVTFGYAKLGMTQYPLREYCGQIVTADIGIVPASDLDSPVAVLLELNEMQKDCSERKK